MDNFISDTLHLLGEEQPLNLPQQDQRAKGGEIRRFHESLISFLQTRPSERLQFLTFSRKSPSVPWDESKAKVTRLMATISQSGFKAYMVHFSFLSTGPFLTSRGQDRQRLTPTGAILHLKPETIRLATQKIAS